MTRPPLSVTKTDDGIHVLTFDREGSSANVFDRATFAALEGALDEVSADGGARALVFASAKRSIFIAGADIHEISSAGSDSELASFLEAGQKAMQRVADLPIVTVAAIHGA
ncbi:MAG: enoyl-CoA hydratase-related protein, partial [Acidobacteriota bacterium]|nr:enoyl-CoA hydratase-related protein [Acidobacteriota bacterium]